MNIHKFKRIISGCLNWDYDSIFGSAGVSQLTKFILNAKTYLLIKIINNSEIITLQFLTKLLVISVKNNISSENHQLCYYLITPPPRGEITMNKWI